MAVGSTNSSATITRPSANMCRPERAFACVPDGVVRKSGSDAEPVETVPRNPSQDESQQLRLLRSNIRRVEERVRRHAAE